MVLRRGLRCRLISTHYAFERCGACLEAGGLFNGSRSTGKISFAWGGVTMANVVAAHA